MIKHKNMLCGHKSSPEISYSNVIICKQILLPYNSSILTGTSVMCDLLGLCGQYIAFMILWNVRHIQSVSGPRKKMSTGRMRPACPCLDHADLDDAQPFFGYVLLTIFISHLRLHNIMCTLSTGGIMMNSRQLLRCKDSGVIRGIPGGSGPGTRKQRWGKGALK